MIKSAITVSLVAQAKGGPFVYWDGLAPAAASAAKLGFDAIEVFAPSAASIDRPALHALLKQHGLVAAAFGTRDSSVTPKPQPVTGAPLKVTLPERSNR